MPRRLLVSLLLVAAACGGSSGATTTPAASNTAPSTEATWVTGDGRVVIETDLAAGEVVVDTIPDFTEVGLPDVVAAFRLQASGSLDGSVATVATDLRWDDALPVLVGLVDVGDGVWEPVRTAGVASVGGTVSLGLQVPRAGTFAVVETPFALDLEPSDRLALVGEQWDAEWSIFDASVSVADAGPLVWAYLDHAASRPMSSVRDLLADVVVSASPRGDGAVSPLPGSGADLAWSVEPAEGFVAGVDERTIGVGAGRMTFTCLAPGAGYGGVTVDLSGPMSAFIESGNADAEVAVRYDIAAPATCDSHESVVLARYLQIHRGLSGPETARFIGRLEFDEGTDDPEDLPATADLDSVAGMLVEDDEQVRFAVDRIGHPCGSRRESAAAGGLPIRIVCAGDAPSDPGEYLIVAATTLGPIPAEPDHVIAYTAAVESDGDPADDTPDGPFVGTDRRYRVAWDPGSGAWALQVVTAGDVRVRSSSRAVIAGDTIVWLVPAGEIAAAANGFRVVFESGGVIDVLDGEAVPSLIPITP